MVLKHEVEIEGIKDGETMRPLQYAYSFFLELYFISICISPFLYASLAHFNPLLSASLKYFVAERMV